MALAEAGLPRAGGFPAFVRSLRDPGRPYLSPARMAKALGLSMTGLAGALGLHRNTLRNAGSEAVQARLREITRILSAASEMTGDVDQAIFWYRNEPIADYRHKTAEALVAEGKGAAVLDYLADLDDGAAG